MPEKWQDFAHMHQQKAGGCIGIDSDGVRPRKEEFIDKNTYQMFWSQCRGSGIQEQSDYAQVVSWKRLNW